MLEALYARPLKRQERARRPPLKETPRRLEGSRLRYQFVTNLSLTVLYRNCITSNEVSR